MRTEDPREIRLADYRPSDFLVDAVELEVTLDPSATRVRARLALRRNPQGAAGAPLVLDGEGLHLISIAIDGRALPSDSYTVGERALTIHAPPERCVLETVTQINPKDNTALEGLYLSQGLYVTQCEAQGFRRITYYIDRPDVLSVFTTRLVAAKDECPVLLSNGNEIAHGDLGNGRHFSQWHDPYPKPAYLFAMAAGRLGCLEDTFTTMTGRSIRLRIFVDPGNEPRVTYAMDALKRSMKWDEERYGLEYDLDDFMIVATQAFNFGAMENKGLNIFNSALLLASPESATDRDYANIEAVVAHEYFHNWTGNRVTCRDWFQLCLKEGLTVFRDQQFSADMRDAAVERIEAVQMLRTRQFPEDDGPLAHPPRPSAFITIDNFYTATVYEKGAEICRMLFALLGAAGFRKGMDLYFERHDGTAARVEDFIAAHADANGRDLTQFMLWYEQGGRPTVRAATKYDDKTRTLEVRLAQSTKPTRDSAEKRPFHIPIAVGLLDEQGRDMALRLEGEAPSAAQGTRLLELTGAEQTFRFVDVARPAARSFLRGFSAPVSLEMDIDPAEDAFLLAHDSDSFNRWEAAQRAAKRLLFAGAREIKAGRPASFDETFINGLGRALKDQSLAPAYKALLVTLPTVLDLGQAAADPVDYESLHGAREALKTAIGRAHEEEFQRVYQGLLPHSRDGVDAAAAGRRQLKAAALDYLVAADGKHLALAGALYGDAATMTDRIAALSVAVEGEHPLRGELLLDFYARFETDPLIIDKWFRIQAMSSRAQALEDVRALLQHPAFDLKSPNRVRSLIGAFVMSNPVRFFGGGERAFALFEEQVLKIDPLNPKLSARLLSGFEVYRRLDGMRVAAGRAMLERILKREKLSENVFEIATKLLEGR